MAVQDVFERLTAPRMRVLALLAEGKTIRQVADGLGCTYNGARSQVRDLEQILDCSSVEEVREWWATHSDAWLGHLARTAGLAG